jgi:hypothetical protein
MSTVDNIERRLDRLEGGEVEPRCGTCADWGVMRVFDEADGVRTARPSWTHPDSCPDCGWTPIILTLERVDVIHAKRDITADLA